MATMRSTPSTIRPMRSRDAFFLYTETAAVAQQVGTVLHLDALPGGAGLGLPRLRAHVAERLPAALRLRPVERGHWRHPGWSSHTDVDLDAHVRCTTIDRTDPQGWQAVAAFWSEHLHLDRPPWQMLLVTGLPSGRSLVAIKLHHSLGDGPFVVRTLDQLLDRLEAPAPPPPRRATPAGDGWRGALLVGRGLAELATAGRAPRSPLNHLPPSPVKAFATTSVPVEPVRRAAREHAVSTSELTLACVAEALHRTIVATRDSSARRLRVMLPVSTRSGPGDSRPGNWTGAVALDLPVGSMAAGERLATVSRALRRSVSSGQPRAAALAMQLMGVLPAQAHRTLARLVYNGDFFNALVSYVPGRIERRALAGAPVPEASPVIALADRVPIGLAAMPWAGRLCCSILLDQTLADDIEPLTTALHDVLTAVAAGRIP